MISIYDIAASTRLISKVNPNKHPRDYVGPCPTCLRPVDGDGVYSTIAESGAEQWMLRCVRCELTANRLQHASHLSDPGRSLPLCGWSTVHDAALAHADVSKVNQLMRPEDVDHNETVAQWRVAAAKAIATLDEHVVEARLDAIAYAVLAWTMAKVRPIAHKSPGVDGAAWWASAYTLAEQDAWWPLAPHESEDPTRDDRRRDLWRFVPHWAALGMDHANVVAPWVERGWDADGVRTYAVTNRIYRAELPSVAPPRPR